MNTQILHIHNYNLKGGHSLEFTKVHIILALTQLFLKHSFMNANIMNIFGWSIGASLNANLWTFAFPHNNFAN